MPLTTLLPYAALASSTSPPRFPTWLSKHSLALRLNSTIIGHNSSFQLIPHFLPDNPLIASILCSKISLRTPPDYSLVTQGNIFPDSSDDLTKDLLSSLSISPFHDDPYMKVIQAYDAIPPPQVIIALPAIVPPPMFDSRDFFPPEEISPPKDTKPPIGSLTPLSLYLSLEMPPKRTSTSAAPAMTQAAIRQLITDGIAVALKAQAAAMANADNPNRNNEPREILVAKRGN
ncbi:hypothetical protein Tco_0252464 [Tanacetum coccineum]